MQPRKATTSRRRLAASSRCGPSPCLKHARHGTPVDAALAPSSLQFPGKLSEYGTRLLDQQIWFWGQDVARQSKNLLTDYGFVRLRSEVARVSTCYCAAHRNGFSISLWSWGLFFGDKRLGGVFLRRNSISPFLTQKASLPHPHWPEGVYPPHRSPQSSEEARSALDLLVGVAGWIARFEDWIEAQAGPEYRRACLREWPRSVGTGERPAELWMRLADEVQREHLIAPKGESPARNESAPSSEFEGDYEQ